MYLTHEEAMRTRCHKNMQDTCVVSSCMAWRWAPFFKDTKTGAAPMKPGAYEVGTAAECGYCGLAGKPDITANQD